MNAAGQTSGMLKERRPAKATLEEMVDEAAEVFASRLGNRVQASL